MLEDKQHDEIERNFGFFMRHVSTYMKDHAGEYALLKERQLIGFFNSVNAADDAGRKRYADGIFSVQKVDDQPVDLGWFSRSKPGAQKARW